MKNTTHHTSESVETAGEVFSYQYEQSRKYIGEMLRDALENGDAISTLEQIQADFRLAMLHELDHQDQEELALSILNS